MNKKALQCNKAFQFPLKQLHLRATTKMSPFSPEPTSPLPHPYQTQNKSIRWAANSTISLNVPMMQHLPSIAKPPYIAEPPSNANSTKSSTWVPILTDFHQETLKDLSPDKQSSIFEDTNRLSNGILTKKSIDFLEYRIEK